MNLKQTLQNQKFHGMPATVDFAVLEESIISKVARLEKNRFTLRLVVWGTLSVLSIGIFVMSGISVYRELVSSGSFALLSIFMTDTSLVLANGSDFMYSLAESLPVGGFAIFLTAISLLLWSLRNLSSSYVKILSTNFYGHKQIS